MGSAASHALNGTDRGLQHCPACFSGAPGNPPNAASYRSCLTLISSKSLCYLPSSPDSALLDFEFEPVPGMTRHQVLKALSKLRPYWAGTVQTGENLNQIEWASCATCRTCDTDKYFEHCPGGWKSQDAVSDDAAFVADPLKTDSTQLSILLLKAKV